MKKKYHKQHCFDQEHSSNTLQVRHLHSASNRRSSSAHSGKISRSRTPRMDANHLNPPSANLNRNSTNDTPKCDDVEVEINEKDMNTVATILANDLLASPNFLRIPLKPIEKLSNDYSNNEKP